MEFINVFNYMRSNFLPIVIYSSSPIHPFVGQLKVRIKYITNILRPRLVRVIKYKPRATFIHINVY